MKLRCFVFSLTCVFVAATMSASHIKVSVTKNQVVMPDDRLEYVVFTDGRPVVQVTVAAYEIDGVASSSRGTAELRSLSPNRWWEQIGWKLTDHASGETQKLRPEEFEVIRATNSAAVVGHKLIFEGQFRLGELSVGDYDLHVSAAGLKGKDTFSVRTGNENAAVREKYLELQAVRTTEWVEYRAIQLQRLDLAPTRADILLDLARRSLDASDLRETNGFFNRAVAMMQANVANYRPSDSQAQSEVQERLERSILRIRGLQEQLPYYFAHRDQLVVAEESVQGESRYVLRDRQSGETAQLIPIGRDSND